EHIHIDGMPLHIIDTAGLRESTDVVEQIGIQRAWTEIRQADRVLLLVDGSHAPSSNPWEIWPEFIEQLPSLAHLTVVRNKIDLTTETPGLSEEQGVPILRLSAREGLGIEALQQHLK